MKYFKLFLKCELNIKTQLIKGKSKEIENESEKVGKKEENEKVGQIKEQNGVECLIFLIFESNQVDTRTGNTNKIFDLRIDIDLLNFSFQEQSIIDILMLSINLTQQSKMNRKSLTKNDGRQVTTYNDYVCFFNSNNISLIVDYKTMKKLHLFEKTVNQKKDNWKNDLEDWMTFQWCHGGHPPKKKKINTQNAKRRSRRRLKKREKKSDYTKEYNSIPKKRTKSDCAEE
ncbi:hypothetical protein RFI_26786 [Reticulomyxa filosa]|uniref:Uncharacterized protein n=1 Tax=Reticulomyxa filosa TaxID=46433 RepID=X6MAU6_RETFI|nr:hypothetical protein RFI_26786 [Reticulomyxa filosa]|eukprot:ETO10592.1 hypothetical protein RFI_26786 [Reticulomyxa filosa]